MTIIVKKSRALQEEKIGTRLIHVNFSRLKIIQKAKT